MIVKLTNIYVCIGLVFSFFAPSLSAMGYPRVSYHYVPRVEPMAQAGLVAAGIALCAGIGYGIYKACEWLFSKSDQQIMQEAQEVLAAAQQRCGSCVMMFEKEVGFPQSVMEKQGMLAQVNEEFLYRIASTHGQEPTRVLWQVRIMVDRLAQSVSQLQSRIAYLRKKSSTMYLVVQMEDLHTQTSLMLQRLSFMHDYMLTHASYFNLFEHEMRALCLFQSALHALEYYAHNHALLREALRAVVLSADVSAGNLYPYMRYIGRMQSEIKQLERSIEHSSSVYAYRLNAAQQLMAGLKTIYNCIVVEDAYRQELRDYERATLERQRLEAEQSKAAAAHAQAAAARAQAAALQDQAWELKKKNRLDAERMHIEKERNVLLGLQTIAQAINPPPAPEVHVHIDMPDAHSSSAEPLYVSGYEPSAPPYMPWE